jgi:hypothetical protein
MKKTILLYVSIFLLSVFSAHADDITIGTQGVSQGYVPVSGTWTKGSTVTVYDHMVIPVGSTLTIEEGVNVVIADTTLKIEMICLGNFYCMGTEQNPVSISVRSDLVPATVATTNPFPGLWGSIVCDTTCTEFLMLYTSIKYYGAATTNNSPSVMLNLYKDAAGQTEPYINYRDHNGGKLVVEHCTFSNGMDDGIYIEGGNVIYAYNTLYQNGFTGGDATNLKAGTIADLGYNFYYSPNTNAFKLSNSGGRSPQCNAVVYNNTIVNAGWRRPTVKGGSIWYEAGVVAASYNNLLINNRFGIKTDGAADPASAADYNYYYGYGKNVVTNFTSAKGLFAAGPHDIRGASAGDKNPMVVNYPLTTDTLNSKYDPTWDFRLLPNSSAIGNGTTNFTRHFGTTATGLTIQGVTYTSPDPSTTIGAFRAIIPVTGVDVSSKTLTINVGESKAITATIAPANADTLTYAWTSTNPSIATVDQNGQITGIKKGTVKIYVKTTDREFTDTCLVTITSTTAVQTVNADDEPLKIFPNPVQSALQLQFYASSNHSRISILSTIGHLISIKDIETIIGLNTISISVDYLSKGLYFITLDTENKKETQLFIKK